MTTWHVYPVDDYVEHDTDTDNCLCGPLVDPVRHTDGSMDWVLVHHSLDGREFYE